MPTFRYRALTAAGDVVSGDVDAPNATEVTQRIAFLGLIPIEGVIEQSAARGRRKVNVLASFSRPRAEDLTIFTGDLALLLRTGARINDALELLASDPDAGRIRPTLEALTGSILSGESFGEALAAHPDVFPAIYVALARVGEASGTLVSILEALSAERHRGEALRRRLSDALRYPAFLLFAAGGVLIFFLGFVLPQFSNVFRDFNAKLDPILVTFLSLSDFMRGNAQALAASVLLLVVAIWLLSRRREVRHRLIWYVSRLPVVRPAMEYHRAELFCRNLGLLLSSGVTLTASLRILADIMETTGGVAQWSDLVDRVRRGGKLSDALTTTKALPPMAVRTLRLGEDSGQLPMLAGRVADFYEAKLQRSLDRMMAIVGPVAIIFISAIVGGLIVSVMTALLSVNQVIN
jgi:general secretion pathway protein F